MKKGILVATMSVLIVSSLNANNDLQNDLNFAFGGEVQANSVTILNDEQMSEIHGKGFGKKLTKVIKNQTSGFNLKKNIFMGTAFVASIYFPPTASVYVPGVVTQYVWAF